MKKVTILCTSILLASCVTPKTNRAIIKSDAILAEKMKQQEMVAEAWVSTETRLYQIGYPILEQGGTLCKNTRQSLGIKVWNKYHFGSDWREAVESVYGIQEDLQVAYVVPGSSADEAGIIAGDVLLGVDDWAVPHDQSAESKFSTKVSQFLGQDSYVTLTVRRAGEDRSINVSGREVCDYNLVLKEGDIKNAFADGNNIVIYQGMMDFFKTDQEAALVISHELAHNSMGHIDAVAKNTAVGLLAGLALDVAAAGVGVNTKGGFSNIGAEIGRASFSVEFEQEADYVGLYFMALAGYEIDGAAKFWRRMAIQNPESIKLKSTHPTTPERFLAIEEYVEEINEKRRNGEVLSPNFSERETAVLKRDAVADSSSMACTVENNCVEKNGEATCMEGFTFITNDADDYRCGIHEAPDELK